MKAFGKKQKKPSAKKSTNTSIVVGDHIAPSKKDRLKLLGKSRRNVAMVIIVTVILAIVVVTLLIISSKNSKQQESATMGSQSNVCADSAPGGFVQRSSGFLTEDKATLLDPLVAEIRLTNSYEKDQNCLYILTVYYTNTGKFEDARKSVEQLARLYDADSLSATLLKNGDLESLRQRLKVYEEQIQSLRKGFVGVGETTESEKNDQ